MRNCDSTQIVTIPENLMDLIRNKKISDDLKELIETRRSCYDELDDFDEEFVCTFDNLCKSCDKTTPQNTVGVFEGVMLRSKHKPNACFINRYAYCLACSCSDQDESYVKTAVDKLRLIIENVEDMDTADCIEYYIACLFKLSSVQEPAQAKITIHELKTVGDDADAWVNIESFNKYCLALEHLCCNQSRAADIQGAYETLETLENIVNTSADIYNITMFECYAVALMKLCENDEVSVSETFELTQKLENLLLQTLYMDNDQIADFYMISLANLVIKQRGQSLCRKKTFERACLVAENDRYKNSDKFIEWYASILVFQMDESNLDNVQLTFKKMTDLASRTRIMEKEFFSEHYNHAKQLLKANMKVKEKSITEAAINELKHKSGCAEPEIRCEDCMDKELRAGCHKNHGAKHGCIQPQKDGNIMPDTRCEDCYSEVGLQSFCKKHYKASEKMQNVIESYKINRKAKMKEFIGFTSIEIYYVIERTVGNNTTGRAMISSDLHDWLSNYYEENGMPDHLEYHGWKFVLKECDKEIEEV